jgi:transcriptional regulator with XRE-family HTH domain
VTGNQIRAARSLAGMNQEDLAEAAKVGINTIRNFEGWGAEIVRGRIETMDAIRSAFRAKGLELIEDGQTSTGGLGVRFISPRP